MPGEADENLETLVGEMVDAKLLAEQWKDACDFASQQIKKSPDYSPTIGPIIRDHIDKLISGNSPADAQKLIEAALAMNPPLDHKIVGQIRDQQAQLNQKPPAP